MISKLPKTASSSSDSASLIPELLTVFTPFIANPLTSGWAKAVQPGTSPATWHVRHGWVIFVWSGSDFTSQILTSKGQKRHSSVLNGDDAAGFNRQNIWLILQNLTFVNRSQGKP